ncbi:MAG TPA: hypothetical protein VMT99_02805 [Candidatus Paceibacterota bacterium]|nr:hypothetical protein [Candidatus Paceibacterota bacterium]
MKFAGIFLPDFLPEYCHNLPDLTHKNFYLMVSIMTNEKLSEYKSKLEKERVMILEEIKRNEKPVDLGVDVVRFEEESDISEEVGNQMAITEDLKKRLSDITSALDKISKGVYGICEKCGKSIEAAILEIDPESRFCINDKQGK